MKHPPIGEYIGFGLYACYTPSTITNEFGFDYHLFRLSDGKTLYFSPIIRTKNICQDCKNLTAGVCYKHRDYPQR